MPGVARQQTYECARAEMGGAPWLEAPKSTDAWFIVDDAAAPARVDEAQRRQRRHIALVAVAAAGVVALVALGTRSRHLARADAPVLAAVMPHERPAAPAGAHDGPAMPSSSAPAASSSVKAPASTPIAAPAQPVARKHHSAHTSSHHHARR